MQKYSAIPGIILFLAIFATTIAIEVIALTVYSQIFNTKILLWNSNFPLAAFSVVLTGWIIALTGYMIFCTSVDFVDDSLSDPTNANTTQMGRQLYFPDEATYTAIILALIGLSAANGNVDEKKLSWIDSLHAQWIRISSPGHETRINRFALSRLATASAADGGRGILSLLMQSKNGMSTIDKEILIRFCFLIVTYDGSASENEANLILDITTAIDFPKARLLEL